jgi:uncharacterized protein YqgV (UPF0045/DUF77 family)
MSKEYEEYIEKNVAALNNETAEDLLVSIDISMYPKKEDFIPPIKGFIKEINNFNNLVIKTFPTSTVVQGEYNHAMNSVQKTIAACHKKFKNAVYVTKVIPDYKALD